MAMKDRRNIQPRAASNYDGRRDSRGESSGPPDDRTLNTAAASVPVTLIRPRKEKGPLTVRPFLPLSYSNPAEELAAARLSSEDFAHSEWIVKASCASYIGMKGCPNFTFLLYPPATSQEKRMLNPYHVFFFACSSAHKNAKFGAGQKWDSEWNILMMGETGHSAAIKKPEYKWFMQAAVLQGYDNKGKSKDYMTDESAIPFGLDPGDPLPIIQMTHGAGIATMRLFNLRKDTYDGDSDANPNLPFVHGSLLGTFDKAKGVINGGNFFTYFDPEKIPEEGPHSSWDGKIATAQPCEVFLSKEYKSRGKVIKAPLGVASTEQVLRKAQFWFDDTDNPENKGLLYYPPPEEQALWIAQAFRKVPRLVQFAGSECEYFQTDEIKGILVSRVSAVMPNTGEADPTEETTPTSGAVPSGAATTRKKKTDPTQAADLYDRAANEEEPAADAEAAPVADEDGAGVEEGEALEGADDVETTLAPEEEEEEGAGAAEGEEGEELVNPADEEAAAADAELTDEEGLAPEDAGEAGEGEAAAGDEVAAQDNDDLFGVDRRDTEPAPEPAPRAAARPATKPAAAKPAAAKPAAAAAAKPATNNKTPRQPPARAAAAEEEEAPAPAVVRRKSAVVADEGSTAREAAAAKKQAAAKEAAARSGSRPAPATAAKAPTKTLPPPATAARRK